MKKILFFILLIWLMTPYSANGQMLVGGMSGGVAAGASCASGTADFTSITTGGGAGTLTAKAVGNSWKIVTNGSKLYSIIVPITSDGSSTHTMRWGTNVNLGTYIGEVTGVTAANGTSNVEFVFADTATTLSTATTYYFGIVKTAGAGSVTVDRDDVGNVYTNGSYRLADSGWNMNNDLTAKDVKFTVKRCD